MRSIEPDRAFHDHMQKVGKLVLPDRYYVLRKLLRECRFDRRIEILEYCVMKQRQAAD